MCIRSHCGDVKNSQKRGNCRELIWGEGAQSFLNAERRSIS